MSKPFTAEDLITESGMTGMFTRYHADGAIPNGSRIRKAKCDPAGDSHPVGSLGTVLGSSPKMPPKLPHYFYFIEWDDMPGVAVGCAGWKIAEAIPPPKREE